MRSVSGPLVIREPHQLGAEFIAIATFDGSPFAEPLPQTGELRIAGDDQVYTIRASEGQYLAISPKLIQPVGLISTAVSVQTDEPKQTTGIERASQRLAEIAQMRDAIQRAEQIAADTERARIEAEREHANKVADALLTGSKMPAKPASLSAVQAADQATDAALESLRKRLTTLEATHTVAVSVEVDADMLDHIRRCRDAKAEALAQLKAAATKFGAYCDEPIEIAEIVGTVDSHGLFERHAMDALGREVHKHKQGWVARVGGVGRSIDGRWLSLRRELEVENPLKKG